MKARRLLDDCFLHDAERLKHEEAMALISKESHAWQSRNVFLSSKPQGGCWRKT